MARFAHAVVGIDGSEPSERAVAFAVTLLAERAGTRLSFACAVDPTVACIPAAHGVAVDLGGLVESLEEDAEAFCSSARATAAAQGVESDVQVLRGTPVEALRTFVREEHADAIVLGTHARRGLARGVLGSVACALVRCSDVPVFVVRPEMEIRADGPIVVAVDDSPPASAAVDAAAALAARLRVPLRLVHVNGHNHAGEDRLDALAAGVRAQGIAVETERCEGRTSSALVAACTRVGASVLATGTHGRGPLERLVLGSVAEALLHDAPVPVMTVRATAGA